MPGKQPRIRIKINYKITRELESSDNYMPDKPIKSIHGYKSDAETQVSSILKDLAREDIKQKHEEQFFALSIALPNRHYEYYHKLADRISQVDMYNDRRSVRKALLYLAAAAILLDEIPKKPIVPRGANRVVGSSFFTANDLTLLNNLMEHWNCSSLKELAIMLAEWQHCTVKVKPIHPDQTQYLDKRFKGMTYYDKDSTV